MPSSSVGRVVTRFEMDRSTGARDRRRRAAAVGDRVAIAPRVWRIAIAHEETPVELPDFAELAAAYRTSTTSPAVRSRAFEVENSQPIAVRRRPRPCDRRVPRRRGQRVLGASRRQRAQPVPGDACPTSRPRGRSRAHRRSRCRSSRTTTWPVSNATAGTRCSRSTYAVRLEKHKSKEQILERYLNTVFFGQNSYGDRRRGRDVLR